MFGWKASALIVASGLIDPYQSTALQLLIPLQLRPANALRNDDKRSCTSSQQKQRRNRRNNSNDFSLSSSSSPLPSDSTLQEEKQERDAYKNTVFIKGLMNNLSKLCDTYICNGSPKTRERVFNVMDQIAAQAVDREMVNQSIRMIKRAGVPMHKTYLEKYQADAATAESDISVRREEAGKRKEWEQQQRKGKSALSRRANGSSDNGRRDLFMPSVIDPDNIATIAKDKDNFQAAMNGDSSSSNNDSDSPVSPEAASAAASRVSKIIATAGSGVAFNGQTLGVGGLDDVLVQIKRRIWTPLAAPPQLLNELGISPARGLLLYGKPGCGKSLLASALGSMLSPFRPITVVSGPEILDKFVGSSEKNLRDIFDNPPDIYEKFRVDEEDGGDSIASAALHVVVMDEFDAVARSRGGSDGKGGQGDAGVARDSVVNQLLAKMDGVQPLCVPTLVIGLTNKRSLIEPALLRPGRFEVQIEIPPPRTTKQRVSVLTVHTKNMHAAGRLQVNDPPLGSTAEKLLVLEEEDNIKTILSYEELLIKLATDCDGFSGAAIAGVARAAASRALERAVSEFSDDGSSNEDNDIMNCLVTQDDFYEAIQDVRGSMGNHDHTEDHDTEATDVATKNDGEDEKQVK